MAHYQSVDTGGEITRTVYNGIKEEKYEEVIQLLERERQNFKKSRSALSLLGHCYYYVGNYEAAMGMYADLVNLFPRVSDYRLNYAHCLAKAGMAEEAQATLKQVKDRPVEVQKILVSMNYEQDNIPACRQLVDWESDDAENKVNIGCILYKEGKYGEANQCFTEAIHALGESPELEYNLALCNYKLKQYAKAMKYLSSIIEKGVRNHPELAAVTQSEEVQAFSVGNSQALRDSALVEAFNLKAAIEYNMNNIASAKEAITDMPPRNEEELDPVTLHNTALLNMDSNPNAGFSKLTYLLANPPFPPETFGNLLLLYCKPIHGFYDVAADVMAENPVLTQNVLNKDTLEYLEACLLRARAPEESYARFEQIASQHVEKLRYLTKEIQDARVDRDMKSVKETIAKYDDALEAYIPILMAMSHVHWEREHYSQVEKMFRQSSEFSSEHEVWKLNVAHTLFMQDTKYKEAIRYYEPIVKRAGNNLLSVQAIVLANLCVAYIMTSQNEEAEEVMRRIEKEEEQAEQQANNKQYFHLCIINLVIGTLYCAKGNFEFGISRVVKSLEPYNKKLEVDTWHYAKRCLLALLENIAKHILIFKSSNMEEVIQFLLECERHGRDIETSAGGQTTTVAAEARLIRKMFIKLQEA